MTAPHIPIIAEAIALGDNTILSWTTKHGIKRDTAYDGIRWLRKEGLAKAVKARAGTPSTYALTKPIEAVREALEPQAVSTAWPVEAPWSIELCECWPVCPRMAQQGAGV